MAEFARSSALERTGGAADAAGAVGEAGAKGAARVPGATGEAIVAIVDEADLRVQAVDATQVIIAAHLEPGADTPPRALLDATLNATGGQTLTLPAAPNTRNGSDDSYVVWLEPGRWLAVSSIDDRWRRLHELQTLVTGATREGVVSDASDALLVLDITGSGAAALMSMACALDIESPSFAPPHSARAPFAGVGGAVLYRRREGFRVHVDAALTAHVREWLVEAARLLPRHPRRRG